MRRINKGSQRKNRIIIEKILCVMSVNIDR